MTPEEIDSAKVAKYQYAIEIATNNVWRHLGERLESIPTIITELTEAQLDILLDVESVEEEWILDPDIRKDISLIQVED